MPKSELNTLMHEEVRSLLSENEGLTPRSLLTWAKRHKKSALYQWLETQGAFDPKRALEFAGLSFCRMALTRVKIEIPKGSGQSIRVRAAVSLPSDRKNKNGYRYTPHVLANEEQRQEALAQFAKDQEALLKKYEMYSGLEPFAEVFRAMEFVERQIAAE